LNVLWLLASGQKDDVALRVVDIAILYVEDLVDAILLQGAELDEQANWTSKRLFNHKILLARNLRNGCEQVECLDGSAVSR
jgi:hypothetical protein